MLGSMGDFTSVMFQVLRFLNFPFTIYGYTFSFFSVTVMFETFMVSIRMIERIFGKSEVANEQ